MTAKQWIGKLTPWVLATVASFLNGVLDIEIGWWPTLASVVTGAVQFIIARMK